MVDLNERAIVKAKKFHRLEAFVSDGCCLPFQDKCFDIVISIDSLEHVPDEKKSLYCAELKRVARKAVIIHCPADSFDGDFEGTKFDQQFFSWYLDRFKREDPNTKEHLESGLPKVEELLKIFTGAKIEGKQSGTVWLRYMKWSQIPYFGLLTGLWYKIFLSKEDGKLPYHACLLVWEKERH